MNAFELTRGIVGNCLQLGVQVNQFDTDTPLLGEIPEFNSLTMAAIIAAIEDELDVVIDDSEITAEIFETMGALAGFVEARMTEI